MLRCVQLAQQGLGTTYPNPLVGSVIVLDDKIIGEGWHYKAGQPHAEAVAITSVKDESQLKDASIYVSLEPCSHFGKTPPCADLIIQSGIKHIVVGCLDPNPKVAGKGIQKLLDAGCDVKVGVEEQACLELNRRFFTFHNKKRPYILLKWAQSRDGFIAPKKREAVAPVWITNTYSRQLSHKLRAEEAAILVGTTTVLNDNPTLTTRDWEGHSPMRVILDRSLKIAEDAKVFSEENKTIILTEVQQTNQAYKFYEVIDFTKPLASQICDVLYRYHIQSVIVEGGTQTLQTFIDEGLWDEAMVFTGSVTFQEGTPAPQFSAFFKKQVQIQNDLLNHYKNTTP